MHKTLPPKKWLPMKTLLIIETYIKIMLMLVVGIMTLMMWDKGQFKGYGFHFLGYWMVLIPLTFATTLFELYVLFTNNLHKDYLRVILIIINPILLSFSLFVQNENLMWWSVVINCLLCSLIAYFNFKFLSFELSLGKR